MVNKPCCIDIYEGDNVSDSPTALAGLDQVKKSGIFALIHKASEGTTERDSRYGARRAKWMVGTINVSDLNGSALTNLSPLWGAYHFFYGSSVTEAQLEAKNFLAAARLNSGDLPFLDWEAVGASGFQPSVVAADAFCQAVEQALGRVCGVYGGNVPRERFAASTVSAGVLERFSKRPFWFAAYGGVTELTLIPGPWKVPGAFLWQDDGDRYGPGPHVIPGMTNTGVDNSTVVSPTTFAQFHSSWLSFAGAQSPSAKVPLSPEVVNPDIAPTKGPMPDQASILETLGADVAKDEVVEANLENEIQRVETELAQLKEKRKRK